MTLAVDVMKKCILSLSKGATAGWTAGIVLFNKAKSKHRLGIRAVKLTVEASFSNYVKFRLLSKQQRA